MKRIAFLSITLLASLAATVQTVHTQDFPSTGHGAFTSAPTSKAYAVAPGALPVAGMSADPDATEGSNSFIPLAYTPRKVMEQADPKAYGTQTDLPQATTNPPTMHQIIQQQVPTELQASPFGVTPTQPASHAPFVPSSKVEIGVPQELVLEPEPDAVPVTPESDPGIIQVTPAITEAKPEPPASEEVKPLPQPQPEFIGESPAVQFTNSAECQVDQLAQEQAFIIDESQYAQTALETGNGSSHANEAKPRKVCFSCLARGRRSCCSSCEKARAAQKKTSRVSRRKKVVTLPSINLPKLPKFPKLPKVSRSKRSCEPCEQYHSPETSAVFTPAPALRHTRNVGARSNGCVYSTAGASGLLFDRTYGSNRDFSTNGVGDILASDNAANDLVGGIDVFLARRRASGRGWEARYFTLFPEDQSIQIGNNATTLLPGLAQLGTSLNGTGPTATFQSPSTADFYNSTDTHVLTRQTEINNLEFNLLKNSQPRFRALSTELLLGFRYFQFGETLLYQAVDIPAGPPAFASPESIDHFTSVENNLLGLQVGARSDYQLRRRLMMHIGIKAGAFNNNVNTRQRVDYRMADGSTINPFVAGGTMSGQRFDVGTEEDVKSVLGEIDLSLSFQLTNSSRIRVGYRAMGITDIAFASNQIGDDFTDATALNSPVTDGDLFLQGAHFGMEFAY